MKTLEEKNKMIAAFEEYKVDYGFDKKSVLFAGHHIRLNQLRYHESWDWLMPVVSKCRSLSNDEDSYWEVIYYTLEECEIITTYQAVIQFIEFYNDQK